MTGTVGALLGGLVAVGVALMVSGLTPSAPRPAAGHDAEPRDYRRLGIRVALAAAAGAAGWLLARWPVGAATGAVMGWFFLRLLGASRRSRRSGTNRIEALAVWAEMLRDGFSAGSGLTTTIAATEHVAPVAIRSEVAVLCARLRRPRLGAVDAALRAFAAEVADPTADTIVIALLLAARGKGADMRTLLSTLAASARAEVNMRLEVEAKRAEILGQRRMIVGVVVVIAGYLLVFRHGYLSPFATPTGQVVVAVIVAIFAASLWLMDRFSRLDVPAPHHATRESRPVIGFAVLGAAGGLGLCLALSGLLPAKATLAEIMIELDRAPSPPVPPPDSLDERVGRVLVGSIDVERFVTARARRDLRMLDIAPATFLASKLIAGLAGLLVGPALAVVAVLTGFRVGWQLPTFGALALAAAGFFVTSMFTPEPNGDAGTSAADSLDSSTSSPCRWHRRN